jgi:hypothetical protein
MLVTPDNSYNWRRSRNAARALGMRLDSSLESAAIVTSKELLTTLGVLGTAPFDGPHGRDAGAAQLLRCEEMDHAP